MAPAHTLVAAVPVMEFSVAAIPDQRATTRSETV
jgi:hypothetical protein